MRKAKLGDLAKDSVTGFKGIVTEEIEMLYNCERVTLSPKVGDDGKIKVSNDFDLPGVKVLEEMVVDPVKPEKQIVHLGDKVKCRLTDLEGYVFLVSLHLSGCRQLGVAPKITDKNKIELQLVTEGQVDVQKEEKAKDSHKETGGPMPEIRPWG